MKHCILWRDQRPCIVTYLGGIEVDCEVFSCDTSALVRLANLEGW